MAKPSTLGEIASKNVAEVFSKNKGTEKQGFDHSGRPHSKLKDKTSSLEMINQELAITS